MKKVPSILGGVIFFGLLQGLFVYSLCEPEVEYSQKVYADKETFGKKIPTTIISWKGDRLGPNSPEALIILKSGRYSMVPVE